MHGVFQFVSLFCLIKPCAFPEEFLMQLFSTAVLEQHQTAWKIRAEIPAQRGRDFIRLSQKLPAMS